MTITATKFNLLATFALGTLFFAPQMSGPAAAGVTTDLMNCKYNSRQKTLNCCEQTLRVNKRPLWLQPGNGNCNTMVRCVGSRASRATVSYVTKPKCYVNIPRDENQGSSSVPVQRTNRSFK